MRHGLRGPSYVTMSACASSNNAMIDAFNYIRLGTVDVMVTGGSESTIREVCMGGFNAMHALSTRNDDPATASRPYDKDRDGFVQGEGSGALILEDLEHAKARGAKIYCEMVGGGMSSDAYHITAPHPEGSGCLLVHEACFAERRAEDFRRGLHQYPRNKYAHRRPTRGEGHSTSVRRRCIPPEH
jgi:3-oxoacyl-[acyl-carrier-protein] synthase II